ncbi:MAG: hypothetical protein U9Q15_04020 [Patescibacteria group bacterium]|nr:hypothetical protein [Patescibacteria group bacterium]
MLSAIVNYGDVSFSGAVLQKYKTFDIDQKRDVASTLIASGAAIGSPYYTILTGETVTNSVAHAFFTKVNQIDTENNTSQTTINTSISAINVATSPATLTGVIATHYVTLGLE